MILLLIIIILYSKIIQKFIRMKMEEYQNNQAKNNLLDLIQKYRVHRLAKVLEWREGL